MSEQEDKMEGHDEIQKQQQRQYNIWQMHTTSKYAQMPNSNINPTIQPTATSAMGTSTSAYRKFQHRRIHTQLDEPVTMQDQISAKYQPYQFQQGVSAGLYKKEYSNNKLEAQNGYGQIVSTGNPTLGNNQSTHKVPTASNLNTNPSALHSKDGLSTLSKNYKYIVKPSTLGAKYLKTQPDAEDTPAYRNKNGNTGSNRSTQIFNNKYEIEGIAGKGTFGVVYFGKNIGNGKRVALKKVLQDKKYKNRELEILKQVKHTNILEMRDFFLTTEGSEEYLNVVMDYYSDNLYQVIKKKEVNPFLIKLYTYQVLRGLNYLNMLSIAHRDIKPQNILVDRNTHKVVICDFGSAKRLVKGQPNIAYICSRCYRAPELIFGATQYTSQIDMWSLGCVIVQMINGQAPFLGDSQIDQLLEIIKILGTPQKGDIEQMNPKYDLKEYKKFPNIKCVPWAKILKTDDELLVDLVSKILQYSPRRRLTAALALTHPYFDELKDLSRSSEPKDLEYLKKMRIKQLPQLYDFTPQQIMSLGLKEKNKKIQKQAQIDTAYPAHLQPSDRLSKQKVVRTESSLGLSGKEQEKGTHFRNNSDYKTGSTKEHREDFNLREEEIKIDKNTAFKPIPKRVPASGLANSTNLGIHQLGLQNPVPSNPNTASNYGRNLSNRFEYR